MKLRSKVLNAARLVFTPVSLLVIAVLIWNTRATLGAILQEARWALLLVVIVLWICANLLAPVINMLLFGAAGHRLSYRYMLAVHCARLPAKYLPGGIWHSVGRAHDYMLAGYKPGFLARFFLLENFLLVAVTLCISAFIVQDLIAIPALRLLVATLTPLAALALVLCPVLLRRLGDGSGALAARFYWASVVSLAIYWCLLGTAFVFYLEAFDSVPVSGSLLQFAAVYVFSWCLGYMALFAPQGIGVSELVSGSLLAGSEVGAVVAFLAGFRLLSLVADLLAWQGVRLLLGSEQGRITTLP